MTKLFMTNLFTIAPQCTVQGEDLKEEHEGEEGKDGEVEDEEEGEEGQDWEVEDEEEEEEGQDREVMDKEVGEEGQEGEVEDEEEGGRRRGADLLLYIARPGKVQSHKWPQIGVIWAARGILQCYDGGIKSMNIQFGRT